MKRTYRWLALVGIASLTRAEEPVVMPTAAAPETSVSSSSQTISVTQAPADVFITLTRRAYPKKQLPTSADSVAPQYFEKFNAINAGEAIARQTGVETLPLGRLGSSITARIRGSTSDQTLIMIDGRPVAGASFGNGKFDLSEIPVESIDRIEILRGGASALYGPNAIGGVINVITKRATYSGHPLAEVGYEQRSFGGQAYRLNFGSRYKAVDYFFYGNKQRESGYRDNSDAKTHNIGGNFGVSMGSFGKFQFDASAYHSNAGSSGQQFPYIPVNTYDNKIEKQASTPFARQIVDTQYVRTSYLLPLGEENLLALRLFGQERKTEYIDPTFVVNNFRQAQSKGGEVQVNLPLGFVVGGNFIYDRLDYLDRISAGNSYIHSTENWGIFIQETFRWKALTLIPSGRYDHHSFAGESKNPRVQTIVDATDWLRVSGSAGRSFRAPTFEDLFTNAPGFFSSFGNPNLRPEHAWTYDAGFEVHHGSQSVKMTYFRTNASDLINLVQIAPLTYQSTNVDGARRQGFEIEIHHAFSDFFEHVFNYTYLENKGIPRSFGINRLVTLSFSPRHRFNSVMTFHPLPSWDMNSVLRFVDTQYDTPDENNQAFSARIASHLTWDIRFAYKVMNPLEFFFGVNNVTDKRYEENVGYPIAGRSFFGGINLKFWD